MNIAIANYIQFEDKAGTPLANGRFQNFFIGETRTWEGNSYAYAPFIVSGTISNRGGDAPRAAIVSVPNNITVGIITDMVLNYRLVRVRSISLTQAESGAFSEGQLLSTEVWSCVNGTQDYEKVSITLSSPLDATRSQIPKRVLSSYLVGSIPASGTVFAS
jgi:phage-related protein